MKIVVIDDEFSALNTFLYYVIDKYDVEFKMFMKNPLDSLEYLSQNNVAAVFLDINLPTINGVELARKMLKIDKKIKIVFISAYAFEKETIQKEFGKNLIGFCDKPYSENTLDKYMRKIIDFEKKVYIETFGSFNVFINNCPLKFLSAKSKELLALLVDRNGSSVTMGEVISNLWPDYPVEKSKILYRDAVWKLRKVLNENELTNLVNFNRAQLNINKIYQCDYWRFLEGYTLDFTGEYMINYDWSVNTQFKLCNIANI